MPQFEYQAITSSGSQVTGTIEAASVAEAQAHLAAKGLLPTEVDPAGAGGGGSLSAMFEEYMKNRTSVKAKELILFSKQMATMFNAGISIVQVFEIMEAQITNRKLKAAVIDMAADIKTGTKLSEAFRAHPDIFNPLYCSMIEAGEQSGALSEVLERLIYIIEHEERVKKDIKSALSYPVMVICALIIAFFVLVFFVLPNFVNLFEKQNIELPMPTKVLLAINYYMQNYWLTGLAIIAAVVTAFILYAKTTQGQLTLSRFVLAIPVVGSVLQKSAMSRFASIFAILQASGVTILDSMDILINTIGNPAIALEFKGLKKKLSEGQGISGPLKSSKYFTPMVINMIAIGEQTGRLDEMMREVATHYDYEVEESIAKLTALIGPLLTAGMTGMVGFFAAGIFLPLVEITKSSLK